MLNKVPVICYLSNITGPMACMPGKASKLQRSLEARPLSVQGTGSLCARHARISSAEKAKQKQSVFNSSPLFIKTCVLVCRCGVAPPAGTYRLTFTVNTFSQYPFHLVFKCFPFVFQKPANANIQKHLENSRLLSILLCIQIFSLFFWAFRCCAIRVMSGFGLFFRFALLTKQSIHLF